MQAKSLNNAVKDSIEPNSIVCTDDWNGYNQLSKLGYDHNTIRKTSGVGKNLLPSANIVISLLKRWLLGIHQGSVKVSHLDYYLDEFTFRFNRRTSRSRGKLFYRLVQQATEVEPLSIKNISNEKIWRYTTIYGINFSQVHNHINIYFFRSTRGRGRF